VGMVGSGLFVAAGLLAGITAGLAQEQKSFVACPIVRDTKSAPCYLAEYEGETYFLGTADDYRDTTAPELKHKVLVEGTVAPGRVCGGIPLKPVVVSVMKEVDVSCNTLLPPEPGIDAPAAKSEAAPALNGDFTIRYGFDSDQIDARDERVLTAAAAEAKKDGAKVRVTGYRAATHLSGGQVLTEKAGIADKRAQKVAALLRSLGVKEITVDVKDDSPAADSGTAQRRVEIVLNR
jgi:outer membrane protein OmpA-like peptidoglycan-associated protein